MYFCEKVLRNKSKHTSDLKQNGTQPFYSASVWHSLLCAVFRFVASVSLSEGGTKVCIGHSLEIVIPK